jgi:hypothetical protein
VKYHAFPHGFIIKGEFVPCGMHLEYIAEHIQKFGKADPLYEDQAFAEAGKRGWIRLTSDQYFGNEGLAQGLGGVDFFGKLTDKRLKLVQDVLAQEGTDVDGVVVEDLSAPVALKVFMNAQSVNELKHATQKNQPKHLREAWADKAARERGLETNPTPTAAEREIREWLEILDGGARRAGGGRLPFDSGYYSPAGMVLDRGRFMKVSRTPPPWCGALKECFQNAQTLATTYPDLRYAEGWAFFGTPLPVLHAWCLDARGLVVDPTWACSSREATRRYFGIVIDTDYMLKRIMKTQVHHSMVDDFEHGYMLLTTRGLADEVIK